MLPLRGTYRQKGEDTIEERVLSLASGEIQLASLERSEHEVPFHIKLEGEHWYFPLRDGKVAPSEVSSSGN